MVILSSVAGQAVPEDVDQVVGLACHNLAAHLVSERKIQHVFHVKANPFRSMLCHRLASASIPVFTP